MPSARRRARALLAFSLLWNAAAAPVLAADSGAPPAPDPACMEGVPHALTPHWQRICTGEKRNLVLNHMHGALAALSVRQLDLAERSLDVALGGIETVYADSPEAEKARSVWHAEEVKDFKGEPYERSMAYYYRGLLYLMKGDYDNAQAAFQGGVLQDTFAEKDRFRADLASQVWLDGWANHCRGNTVRAQDRFAEAKAINPALNPPGASDRVLVIAETGQAPAKFRAGNRGSKLGIREGFVGNYRLDARLGGAVVPMVRAEDVFFQATTRGGRPADGIMAEKAATKDTAEAVGVGMMAGGMTMAAYNANYGNQRGNNNNDAAAAGLAVALIGLMIYAASQGMDPGADIRSWITLPHSIHLAAAPTGAFSPADFSLLDPAGRDVLTGRDAVVTASAGPCSVVWVGAHAIAPSLAAAASADGGAGNCRTSTGAIVSMAPPTCRRIGGQVLVGGGSVSPETDAAAASSRFSGNCLSSTGALRQLDAETCQRIGGTPQR